MGGLVALSTFDEKLYAKAFSEADRAKSRSQSAAGALDTIEAQQQEAVARQEYVLAVQSRRFQALDMMRAIESLLPHDPPGDDQKPLADRRELSIEKMDCQYFPDLATWFGSVKTQWQQTHPADGVVDPLAAETADAAADTAAADAADGQPAEEVPTADDQAADAGDGEDGGEGDAEDPGPQGPGWVIELAGHHFHNEPHHKPDEAAQFLR